MFAPEYWAEVQKFRNLHSGTYKFNRQEQLALAGVLANFNKALRLLRTAEQLLPTLETDNAELEAEGMTAGENAAQLNTVFEAMVLSLYSTLDCSAKVVRAVFGRGARNFRASTTFTFENFHLIAGLPPLVTSALAQARWFRPLRLLRDQLTHYTEGHSLLDPRTGRLQYMHEGVTRRGRPLIIPDAMIWANAYLQGINAFLGAVFHAMNETLDDSPVMAVCGMIQGRVLHRYISPKEPMSFQSGQCGAWVWFEKHDNPTCPFAENCGAYQRKHPPEPWQLEGSEGASAA